MRFTYQSLDSSVGRAGDCRGNSADISRSLVQIRFEGDFFFSSKQKLPMNPKNPNFPPNLTTILHLLYNTIIQSQHKLHKDPHKNSNSIVCTIHDF